MTVRHSLGFAFLSASALTFSSANPARAQAPSDLSSEDLQSVRALHSASRHAAVITSDGFRVYNPRQLWDVRFDCRGFLVTPSERDWAWGLELRSYGLGAQVQEVGNEACASAEDGRVAYRWDDYVEEWYVNDERGLEHGYTIHQRPQGDRAADLMLTLQVRGELEVGVSENGRDVRFLDRSGRVAVDYSGLTAFDANGRVLSASFEARPQGLVLTVEQADAVYPITIDPIAQQYAFLKASNTGLGARFGESVAIDGDTLVVGASADDSVQSNSGAAYVFVRNGTTWEEQALLKASTVGLDDLFGGAVAISGDTIVVSAIFEDSLSSGVNGSEGGGNLSVNAGAAYVFVRSGTSWTQEAYLKASNPNGGDRFGRSVSISGDTIIVSSTEEDSSATGVGGTQLDNSGTDSGAAYVFVRNGSTWSQETYLKASNSEPGDRFGADVSIFGDTLVVSTVDEKSTATGVNGNEGNNASMDTGAAYVFVRVGSSWTQQAYLKASNTGVNDRFGTAVSISADTIVVGARGEDGGSTGIDGDQLSNAKGASGAVYVFVRNGTTWAQEAYVKASNTGSADYFGWSVSVDGDRLAVAAQNEASRAQGVDGDQSNNSSGLAGAAYMFSRTGTVWAQDSYLKGSNTESNEQFGHSLSVSGGTLIVGAWRDDSGSTGVNGEQFNSNLPGSGAAHVFEVDLPCILPGTDFCSGDGGDQMGCTNCPCGNNAAPGTIGGCLNSFATSARLKADGDPSVSLPVNSATDLRFTLSGVPSHSFCILNSGDGVAPSNGANPCFGQASGVQAAQFDGLRCAVTNTRRHGGRSADYEGVVGNAVSAWGGLGGPPLGIAQAGGGFVSGQTRYFQVIHRDDPLASCMRSLNTSQAVEITFTP